MNFLLININKTNFTNIPILILQIKKRSPYDSSIINYSVFSFQLEAHLLYLGRNMHIVQHIHSMEALIAHTVIAPPPAGCLVSKQ